MVKCKWCESDYKPSQTSDDGFCGSGCRSDSEKSLWPSWMTGRVGPEARKDWHMTGDFLCLSAPNRFRNIYRRKSTYDGAQAEIIALQKAEFPHLENPLGLDFDFPSFDQVLIWKGPKVADALNK